MPLFPTTFPTVLLNCHTVLLSPITGYHTLQKKAGYIKRVSQILLDEYGGDIPATMDQLVATLIANYTPTDNLSMNVMSVLSVGCADSSLAPEEKLHGS